MLTRRQLIWPEAPKLSGDVQQDVATLDSHLGDIRRALSDYMAFLNDANEMQIEADSVSATTITTGTLTATGAVSTGVLKPSKVLVTGGSYYGANTPSNDNFAGFSATDTLDHTKGAAIILGGVSRASSAGCADYYAGNVSGGVHRFNTGNAVTRVTIADDALTLASGVDLVSAKATVNLTAQSADIAATNAFTTTADGWYRVSVQIALTRAASVSSTLPSPSIVYTRDDGQSVSFTLTPNNPTGNLTSATWGADQYTFYAKTGTNISYSTATYASSGATTMQFSLHLVVERIR